MEKILINFTNHPSNRWSRAQREEALQYGTVKDIPFPPVDPEGDEAYTERLAELCVRRILQLHPDAVLCQGEFCLAYQVARRLTKEGIPVLAACSERTVKETGKKKEVIFEFKRFRRYGKEKE